MAVSRNTDGNALVVRGWFRSISVLENNPLKEISRLLECTEALFLENYKDVNLVQLLRLNVRCNH